jgi:hypothetical protein
MTYTLQSLDGAVIDSITNGHTGPTANRQNALAIRAYGDAARSVILRKRAEYRARQIATSHHWQHKISRRPLRNAHWDSWSIRERYMRGTGTEYPVTVSCNPHAATLGAWRRVGRKMGAIVPGRNVSKGV